MNKSLEKHLNDASTKAKKDLYEVMRRNRDIFSLIIHDYSVCTMISAIAAMEIAIDAVTAIQAIENELPEDKKGLEPFETYKIAHENYLKHTIQLID